MKLNFLIENTSEKLKEPVSIYKKCLYTIEKDLEALIKVVEKVDYMNITIFDVRTNVLSQ